MRALALAEQLGPERGTFDLETAALALATDMGSRLSRMSQRKSGVPEKTIDRRVAGLGVKRSREAANRLKTAALTTGRQRSAEVRRSVGALSSIRHR